MTDKEQKEYNEWLEKLDNLPSTEYKQINHQDTCDEDGMPY